MIEIGKYNKLEVARIVSFGLYLTDGEEDVLLPEKYAPKIAKVGDMVDVFVYTDSEDRIIATTETPFAMVGEIAKLRVVDVNRVGAFMDWGLPKDLFVPFKQQRERMEVGEDYVVKLLFDERSNRVMATNKFSNQLIAQCASDFKIGDKVEIQPLYKINAGYIVSIDKIFSGMLYNSDIFCDIALGEKMVGYITKLREDKKVDVALRKAGLEGAEDLKPIIVEKLKEAKNNFIALNTKSSPEDIKKYFKMSKKVFKKVVGMLYKEKIIEVNEKGIKLITK
ncbi:S1-like domain-containing RNA-binding protein [Lentisphaerota bacterium WC36G]|nr:GntR family transcriptional regulator [Lentisphaerae bacterium WC36]